MRLWQKTLLWVVGVFFALCGAHALTYPTITFNYRLTIEAMTPDGPKTGATVIQVSYGSQFNLSGGGLRDDTHVTGEALYLDLGQGKNLFVTLSTAGADRPWDRESDLTGANNALYLPVKVFGFKWDWGNEWNLWRQVNAAEGSGPREVPLVALPTTVTFRDIKDPKSVERVDPRDISQAFGPAYVLTGAMIELTQDGPTEGISTLLPWLADLKVYLGGSQVHTADETSRPWGNELHAGNFKLTEGKI
jgi:hypothetical protein